MSSSSGPDIITNGLVLHLDAADRKSYPGSGTVWTDRSGNGKNGTLIGGTGYNSINGGSLTFDGVDDHIEINPIVLTSSYTITQTLIGGAGSNVHGYMPIGGGVFTNGGDYRGYIWFLNTDGVNSKVFFRQDGEADGCDFLNITPSLTEGIIFQYTLVKNLTNVSFYINSNLMGTGAANSAINFTIRRLGHSYSSSNTTYRMNRNLYNTTIYNRALSISEIKQNFNATKSRFGLL
jgi:hypothetical protein